MNEEGTVKNSNLIISKRSQRSDLSGSFKDLKFAEDIVSIQPDHPKKDLTFIQ